MNRPIVQAMMLCFVCGIATVRASVVVESFGIIGSDPEENLFSSIGPPTSPGLLASPGAVEEWPVSINLSRLQTLPETVVLNLPDQESEALGRLRARPRADHGFLWTGGGEGCSAVLSAIPNRFRAVISCLSGNYGVETTPDGVRLTRYAYGSAPPGADDDVAVPDPSPTGLASPTTTTNAVLDEPLLLDQKIDVLILYTANVRLALQAASINVQQYMEDTLATTQLAMDRSTTPGHAVIAELNLAHAQEVARTDNSTIDFSSDLEYLRLDSIPTNLRNTYAADLVMLIRETSPSINTCGLASTPNLSIPPGLGFAPFAVGVTKRVCSFSAYPFQHEFGHLFGANHNPENNSNTSMLHPWAQAHWANASNPEDSARTIVSYQIGACHGTCPQVLNYSNAAITVSKSWNFHTGIAGQRENALIIEEFASVTAQYRSSLDRIFANGFD